MAKGPCNTMRRGQNRGLSRPALIIKTYCFEGGSRAPWLVSLVAVFVAGCSVFAGPTVQKDWDYEKFNQFQTFANVPLKQPCDSNAKDPAVNSEKLGSKEDRCDSEAEDSLVKHKETGSNELPKLVASSRVPWQANIECRNTYRSAKNWNFPTRQEVLEKCLDKEGLANEHKKLDTEFIAIGISGGGTKSAVFSTEALLALDHWGVLDHTDMISSVSGGSFAAALYAVSCDPPYCDEYKPGTRLRWEAGTSNEQAGANVLAPLFMKRYFPPDLIQRGLTHRKSSNVLAETIDWRILSDPDSEEKIEWTESGFFTWFRTAPDESGPLEFRHLNPRRPNLVLNATNVTADRQYLESEADIPFHQRRLKDKSDRAHFPFTDYYFERLLHSDLSRYPLGHAVAASAAFPAVMDYVTVGRFKLQRSSKKEGESTKTSSAADNSSPPIRPNSNGDTKKQSADGNAEKGESVVGARNVLNTNNIDFVHLSDGGIHDNHGLTEIRHALRDIFEKKDSGSKPPGRVLTLVLDASLSELNGIPSNEPHPLGVDSLISPARAFNIDQTTSVLLVTNAAQHDERFRTYLKNHVQRACEEETGPLDENSVCAVYERIGFESMDGYESVLVNGVFHDCNSPEARHHMDGNALNLSDSERIRRKDKQRQCDVMQKLRKRKVRKWLGLGDYHPQCYVEATRSAVTSYTISDEMELCLRHAARWAVAMKMAEICDDAEFGKHNRFGINCSRLKSLTENIASKEFPTSEPLPAAGGGLLLRRDRQQETLGRDAAPNCSLRLHRPVQLHSREDVKDINSVFCTSNNNHEVLKWNYSKFRIHLKYFCFSINILL